MNKDRENRETEPQRSNVKFPISRTVKMDFETDQELEVIVLFERKSGVSTLIRDWIVTKVKGYQRNPHYLKFKKKLKRRENERK